MSDWRSHVREIVGGGKENTLAALSDLFEKIPREELVGVLEATVRALQVRTASEVSSESCLKCGHLVTWHALGHPGSTLLGCFPSASRLEITPRGRARFRLGAHDRCECRTDVTRELTSLERGLVNELARLGQLARVIGTREVVIHEEDLQPVPPAEQADQEQADQEQVDQEAERERQAERRRHLRRSQAVRKPESPSYGPRPWTRRGR